MNIYAAALVIFLTALAAIGGSAWLLNRGNAELDRIILLARVEEGIGRTELPRAGRFDADWWPSPGAGFSLTYGQPPDTGPLLILGEKDAANVALERDIEAMCAEAEAKIPPRWR